MAHRTILGSAFVAALALSALPAHAQATGEEVVGGVVGGFLGLLIALVIGAVVGWLASLIVKGSGSGLFADILFGIGGAILAGWVLPLLGVSLGGAIGGLIASVLGAVVLILIVRAVRRAA